MKTLAIPALMLTLAACDLENAQDTFEGLTNPLVMQGLVIAVEPPESEDVDLEGTGFEEGTTGTVFLADARSADDLESAPVSGANVTLGQAAFTEGTAGAYVLSPAAGFEYRDGNTARLSAGIGGDSAVATVPTPAAASVTLPEEHTPNTALTIPMGGTDFHSALVVVIDVQGGGVVWTNKPQTIRETYDLTRGTAAVDVQIPASAFGESVYAVGVAGLKHTTAEDLSGMNTAISSVLAGKMKFHIVPTIEIPEG